MPDILALLLCLQPCVSMTTVRQLSRIALALLAMTDRVTMRGIARWTGAGGSYRTVQRFFATALPWAQLLGCSVGSICCGLTMSICSQAMRWS